MIRPSTTSMRTMFPLTPNTLAVAERSLAVAFIISSYRNKKKRFVA